MQRERTVGRRADGSELIRKITTLLWASSSVLRRLFAAWDVILSASLLLLFSPLCLLFAIWVKCESSGSVLFAQTRIGYHGKPFRMLKFRTMRRDAEDAGPGWSRPDDPRRTRFGVWLRRFSLDELPQLWNVLKGDMSLVGPRPEQAELIREFRREIPSYMLRHKVKSGMTGWAQVHGLRGDTSLHARIEHDIYYIQNWSLGLDFKIILMTIWSVVRDRDVT